MTSPETVPTWQPAPEGTPSPPTADLVALPLRPAARPGRPV